MSSGVLQRFLAKAALISAAFVILAPHFRASAEVKVKKYETFRDLIEKAYNLSLQKDRAQAVTLLVSALKQEHGHEASTAELKKALQQVAYMFYSDQTQQAYELALSSRKTDLSQAQQKLAEALRSEPDNLTIFNEMQRVLLIKGDCSTALDNVQKQRLQNPVDEELLLLQAQGQACLTQWGELEKTLDTVDLKKTTLAKYWMPLEIDEALATKDLGKARDLSVNFQKIDARDPEATYWQWRVANLSEKAVLAEKYLKECKNISSRVYRQYMTDVNLCRKMAEVEVTNKNANGTNE